MVEADKKKNTVLDVLRSQKGFSLSELLVTLVLIGLITLAMAGGIGMIVRSYTKVVDRADAEQLLSTTVSRITDELSFALPYSATMMVKNPNDHTTVDFVSGLTGMRVRITKGTETDPLMHMYYYYYNQALDKDELKEIPLIDSKLKNRMTVDFESIEYNNGCFTIENIAVRLKEKNITAIKIDSYTVARINDQPGS